VAQDSFGVPPIPVHLAQLPTVGGLVVPYITLRHRNGAAALGLVDYSRMVRCFEGHRCGVCAETVSNRMVFLMRSLDLIRSRSAEPGLCPPCAAYTMMACPMVASRMAHYRRSQPTFMSRQCGDPECSCSQWTSTPEPQRYGHAAEQWFALWTTEYRLTRGTHGRLEADFTGMRVLRVREVRTHIGAPEEAEPSA
jgi:hypothetical protein